MKMKPLRLVAGAGALAGAAAGSVALAVPEAAAETAAPTAPAPLPLILTDVAAPDLYGAPVSFTLTVSNPSTTNTAHQPHLSDVLPAGVTYQAPPPPPPVQPTTASTAAPASPTTLATPPAPPPPPPPTVTVNPDGTTTLDWSGLADIAPGGQISLTFSAQPAVPPSAHAYLPGSIFSDSATATADTGQPQKATGAVTVPVTTVSVSQSAVALPSTSKTGTVMDTISVTGAPGLDTSGAQLDLFLPASVSLGKCLPAPAPCSLPAASTVQIATAAPNGLPVWPLAPGPAHFVDLSWKPGQLAAGATKTFSVPLQVTNPPESTGAAPAVMAVVSGQALVGPQWVGVESGASTQVVGTPPPPPSPPVPTTTSTTAAPKAAAGGPTTTVPATPPVTVPAATTTTVTVPPAAAPPVPARSVPSSPAPKVQEAVVRDGSAANPTTTTVSPFVARAALPVAAPTGSSSAPQPAPATVGRDPFLIPGQVQTVTPTVQQPTAVVAGVTVTANPQTTPKAGGLAYTGVDAQGLAGLAAGLLAAGTGLLLASLRRRNRTASSQY